MINTRDINEVSLWLKKYPNISMVTRDGSIIYKSSILVANSDIIQISDRFHILKNMSEAVCNEIDNIMPSSLLVEKVDVNINQKASLKERFLKVEEMICSGYSQNEACKEALLNWRTYRKIKNMNKHEFEKYFESKTLNVNEHCNESRQRKKELISKVNEMYVQNYSFITIAKTLNINRRTVREYINPNYVDNILSGKNHHKPNEADKFSKIILELISKKTSVVDIHKEISSLGYSKTYSNLRAYIRNLRLNNKLSFDITISRHEIKDLIFHKRNEVIFPRKYLLKVFDEYPNLKKVIEIFYEFKNCIIKCNDPNYLNKVLNKINHSEFKYLKSVSFGLQRDYDAVVNAVLFPFSNGITEAKVNVTKLNKRKMYGRCSFELLRKKTILFEQYYQ